MTLHANACSSDRGTSAHSWLAVLLVLVVAVISTPGVAQSAGETGPTVTPPETPAPLPAPGELARLKGLIESGDTVIARARLESIVEHHPGWARALLLLALTYHREQRHELARPLFERALDADPQQLAVRAPYGWCLLALGELETAEEMFEVVLAHHADHAESHYALGVIAFERDDVDGARARLERAITLAARAHDPSLEGRARARLGELLVRTGDLVAARRELERAVALRPHARDASFQLARVLERLGEKEAAALARARADAAPPKTNRPELEDPLDVGESP